MRSDPGQNIVFGDASRSRVLHRAGVKRARLLAVTFDERQALDGLSKRRVSAASIVTRIRPRINSELRDRVEV
jgi:voltage-gated potassium channel Kch